MAFFPNDKVLIEDAHAYLLNHFREFDFIWASPPCPTHSKVRMNSTYSKENGEPIKTPCYPDMRLYEEIILLDYFFKGKFVIENVISFYEPLIKPYIVGSHYFWANFPLVNFQTEPRLHDYPIQELEKRKGFNLSSFNISNELKRKVLHNCVEPEVGKAIFEYGFKSRQEVLV